MSDFMESIIIRNVASCRVIQVQRLSYTCTASIFRLMSVLYLPLILKMEAVCSSETSVRSYGITAQKIDPFSSIFTFT